MRRNCPTLAPPIRRRSTRAVDAITPSSSSRASAARRCARRRRALLAAVVGVREADEAAEPALHVVAVDGHARRQAEHLHRPPPLGRDARPRRRVRRAAPPSIGATGARRRRRAHARDALRTGAAPRTPRGARPGARARRRRRGTPCAGARRRQRGRGHDRADHLRVPARPWTVELERRAAPASLERRRCR